MSSFFKIDGPLMRGLSELTNLVILNILTVVCSLPVFTAGAAITSMHYCIMKMSDDEDSHLVQMFFTQFKDNFKTMTPAWLLFLAFGVFLYFDYQVFVVSADTVRTVALVLIYAALIIYMAIYVWFFPMAARFENGFLSKFKNAFYMAIGALPRTLGMMVIWVVVVFVLSQSLRLMPIFALFGLSLPAYLSAFLYYPVIKKQIKVIRGEDDEDDDNLTD